MVKKPRFERSVLLVMGGLVAAAISAAIINPPVGETAIPRASLETPSFIVGVDGKSLRLPAGLVRVRGVGSAAEALVEGVPVGALNNGHRARNMHTSDVLYQTFERIGYNLDTIRAGEAKVPRLFLVSLPDDLGQVHEPKQRKAIFFKTVLPLVLQVNDEILADRARLKVLRDRLADGKQLAAVDRLWLIVLAEGYNVKRGDLKLLTARVDIIPPSLALAQAAEESGWGTSRFVREGNAIFGEWTFVEDKGIVPYDRKIGKTHRVRRFASLLDSVRAYVQNLNTHPAYKRLRAERWRMRSDAESLRGGILAATLTAYSERGADYVATIQTIMSTNNLNRLDGARLKNIRPERKSVI
jgi:Bax protein